MVLMLLFLLGVVVMVLWWRLLAIGLSRPRGLLFCR